jgi:hypothetical protein
MGSAGFEPANSSAQGWHHTKLDNDPSFILLYIFLGLILSLGSFSTKDDSFLTVVTTSNNFCKSFMRDYSMF